MNENLKARRDPLWAVQKIYFYKTEQFFFIFAIPIINQNQKLKILKHVSKQSLENVNADWRMQKANGSILLLCWYEFCTIGCTALG